MMCRLQFTFDSPPVIIMPPVSGSQVVITPNNPLEASEVQIVVCVPPGKLCFTEDKVRKLPYICIIVMVC
jgi:hypothetical protein